MVYGPSSFCVSRLLSGPARTPHFSGRWARQVIKLQLQDEVLTVYHLATMAFENGPEARVVFSTNNKP